MTVTTPLELFKALSEQTRLYIVLILHKEGSLCVCELEAALQADQPKVSRHLALLRNHNILQTERRGKWVYYTLSANLPTWVGELLASVCEAESTELQMLLSNLKQMTDRPSACCA